MARDLALDALERRQPVAWVGGPRSNFHHGKLLVAYPVPFDTSYWAVRCRGTNNRWFFRPFMYSTQIRGNYPLEDSRKLTKPYFWTLRRVQDAVAHCYGILDLAMLPESVRIAVAPLPPAIDADQARARRRERRRQSMSPAEKEQRANDQEV